MGRRSGSTVRPSKKRRRREAQTRYQRTQQTRQDSQRKKKAAGEAMLKICATAGATQHPHTALPACPHPRPGRVLPATDEPRAKTPEGGSYSRGDGHQDLARTMVTLLALKLDLPGGNAGQRVVGMVGKS